MHSRGLAPMESVEMHSRGLKHSLNTGSNTCYWVRSQQADAISGIPEGTVLGLLLCLGFN